jgi:uncharacterized RDD family membrane protein YckC
VRQAFETSSGPVEVIVDEESRTVSAYRFDGERRAVAAAMGSWDYADLTDVLTRQVGLSPAEAEEIASNVKASHAELGPMPPQVENLPSPPSDSSDLEEAGLALRFVAVLLDSVIVFLPLALVVGLLYGGGYSERGNGDASAGVIVNGKAELAVLALCLGYYILCEAVTGMTLGKRLVGIRVVADDGHHVGLNAAVVRNLLRPIDGLVLYLVGAIFVLASRRSQRLGDHVAGTLVVRR